MFHYKVGGKRIRVSLSEVYYFSSRGRKITIHKMNEEEEFYGILEKVYSEVKNKHFLYVHKSYIVNYQYIKKMEYEQVTLKGGETIPISQARRTAIRKQFHELKKEEL
jgi:DNA-binding LytR/AlgR family response regulator